MTDPISASPSLSETSRTASASLGDVTRAFARVGVLSFGGPAAQIALMHKVVVDDKKWLPEDRFLHALNYCMLLPGPEAMQLATYIGWLLQGVRGGLIAGALFVLPGFLVLLALATLYVTLGDVPAVEGLLFGLQAAVLALVVQALMKLSAKTLTSSLAALVALAAFVALYVFDVPFPIVILVAAGLGVAAWGRAAGRAEAPPDKQASAVPAVDAAGSIRAAIVCAALWLAPVAVLVLVAGLSSLWTQQALFFSWTAIITFGGAYAVLAYITQVVVQDFAWLSTTDMVTGLGLAETTPGPLILVLVFVGYVAAAKAGLGLDPVAAGLLGGTLTVWVTFMPCFVWIFLGAPFVERTREIVWLKNALRGVTAAVVGVIASLAVWFAVQVLFGEVETLAVGPASLPVPVLASVDWSAAALAVFGGVLLFGLRAGLFATLAVCAFFGIALRLAGLA